MARFGDTAMPDFPRRWAIGLSAAAVALALAVVALLVDARREAADVERVLTREIVRVLPAAPAPSATAPPSRVQPVATETPVRPSRPAGPGEIEVCGIGPVPARSFDAATAASPIAAIADAARAAQAALDGLAESAADPRVRAAALRVLAGGDGPPGASGAPVAVPDDAAAERLSRLATASDDPFVLALALDACRPLGGRAGAPRAASCQLLSVEQWARRDPGNAAAWLHLATQSDERGEPGGAAEAVHRATLAPRLDWPATRLGGRLVGALPVTTPPLVRDLVGRRAAEAAAGIGQPGRLVPYRHCDAASLADANRRQACDRLAGRLVDGASDAADLGAALELGRRLGWTPERLDALQAQTRAIEALERELVPAASAGGCEAMQRRRDWALQVQALGVVGAARDQARRRGLTLEELGRRTPGPPGGSQAGGAVVEPAGTVGAVGPADRGG